MSTLFTVRAAADRLGVGYSTLKQWIYDGAVRTVRTRGGHHRLTELEVQRLLLAGSVGPATAPAEPTARLSVPVGTRPRAKARKPGTSRSSAAGGGSVLLAVR